MNWGTKLVIGMGIFMTFIMVMVILMFNSRTDALVDVDYYEKGLKYNEIYTGKEQVKTDGAKPEIQLAAKKLTLEFKANAHGNIRMMRTSDHKMDKSISFETDTNHKFIIPTTELDKGRWRLIINWMTNEKYYLDEQEVDLQ